MPKVKITSITPNTAQCDEDITATIEGENFTNKTKVTDARTVEFINATQLNVVLRKERHKAGKWNIIVKEGRDESTLNNGLETFAPPPSIYVTAGGQIYIEWEKKYYERYTEQFHIYRDGTKIDSVDKGDNKTTSGKEYYVDVQTKNGESHKYKVVGEDDSNLFGHSNETEEIEIDVFKTDEDSELHFFLENDDFVATGIGADEIIAKFNTGKLNGWSLLKAYMCMESYSFLIYSVIPQHKSSGSKRSEITTLEEKCDGDVDGTSLPYIKGIHFCDTTAFGSEHTPDVKTSILLFPRKAGKFGYFWSVHEKAPPAGKKMSELTIKTEIATHNRKIVFVNSLGLTKLDTVIQIYTTVAHEFQHLLYYGHDRKTNNNATWLDEGLAVYSVDLNNYWAGNSAYETRLKYVQGAFKTHTDYSRLRISDENWRDSDIKGYHYGLSGVWTTYLARRFPGKLKEYGTAKDDHESDVYKIGVGKISTVEDDKYPNIFAEWALANYLNKIVVDVKKNRKKIALLSNITNFETDVDAGKYNYYVPVLNSDIKEEDEELETPNTNIIRELNLEIPDATVIANIQNSKTVTVFTDLLIKKGSIRYLHFKVNAGRTKDRRLHLYIKDTDEMVKIYSVEDGLDNKTCYVGETLAEPSTKEIQYSSKNNQNEVVAIIPNHKSSDISVKYKVYCSQPPKIKKLIFSQDGEADKETLARNKTKTLVLEKSTEVTIKVVFDQEMLTNGNGNYTLKAPGKGIFAKAETLSSLASKYYGNKKMSDKIEKPNPDDDPKPGEVLGFPMKIWYKYSKERDTNDFTIGAFSKTDVDNDTLELKCTPDANKIKKKSINIYFYCAANFGKDLIEPEIKYNFKIKISKPKFSLKRK